MDLFTIENLAQLYDLPESEIVRIGKIIGQSDPEVGWKHLNDAITRRVLENIRALSLVLRKDDDLGKMVRAHIHIEHELEKYIFAAAPNPSQLKSFASIEYSEKVHLALVLALRADLKPALSAVGSLRNKFAHNLHTTLDERVAKDLVATFSPSDRQHYHSLLQSILSDKKLSPSAKEKPPQYEIGMRVMVFFLHLFREISAERNRAALAKLSSAAKRTPSTKEQVPSLQVRGRSDGIPLKWVERGS